MTESTEPTFLDVEHLLEASLPKVRTNWFWYIVGGFLFVVMLASYVGSQSSDMKMLVDMLSIVVMLGIGMGMALLTASIARKHRAEHQMLEAIEECVQLRRWEQAAGMLQGLLSRPCRLPQARAQALLYLSSVLARYHRFNDAINLQTYLIDREMVEPGTAYGLRLGRAMSMLREDHLVDADRAIGEIRRMVGDQPSGGLALVEIYRDVKTGHFAEAVEVFEKSLKSIREQLGHRVADAYALTACACDRLDRSHDAQRMFDSATRLAPVAELVRRYPEVTRLIERYSQAVAPGVSA